MSLKTANLTPRIGTQIEADKNTLLMGAAAAEIRALLEQRGVLVFRGVAFDDDEQIAFTRTLGTSTNDGIYKVTFDKKENPTHADYNYGNFSWHMDRTDTDIPPLSSILSARKLTFSGGQTEFANTYAAYEDLPESDKKLLNDLKVVHKVELSFRESIPEPTEAQLQTWRSFPPKTHPLVWRHRSGRKSLVMSTSVSHVVGMDEKESEALLRRLMAWTTRPEYVYRHEWQLGDAVMWDNTGTMHRVLPYLLHLGRRMHRTTLAGEEPLAS